MHDGYPSILATMGVAISLVHQPENEELFSTLGVDFIVNVNDLIINDMESKTAAILVEEV